MFSLRRRQQANKNPPPFASDGLSDSLLNCYSFNLPSPTPCATATQRSHAARFDIQVTLAVDCFTGFKNVPAL